MNFEEKDIVKRDKIDNNTFKEINEKYPKYSKKGVAYNNKLVYISLENGYLEEPAIYKLVMDFGAEILAVILYFRFKMCRPFGWYCKVDKDSLEALIAECAFRLNIDKKKITEYLRAIIDRKVFYTMGSGAELYLADTQQLFNYEIMANERLRDRERKAKKRAAEKEDKESVANTDITVVENVPTGPPTEEFPFEDFNLDENIFGDDSIFDN